MREKLLMLLLLVLTTILSYSQDSYPKKIKIREDVVVGITEQQLQKVNQYLLRYKDLKLFNDSLLLLSVKQEENVNKQITLNRLLNTRNMELLVQNSDLMILNDTNEQLISYYKKEIKVRDRKCATKFFWGVTIGVSVTSLCYLIFK